MGCLLAIYVSTNGSGLPLPLPLPLVLESNLLLIVLANFVDQTHVFSTYLVKYSHVLANMCTYINTYQYTTNIHNKLAFQANHVF